MIIFALNLELLPFYRKNFMVLRELKKLGVRVPFSYFLIIENEDIFQRKWHRTILALFLAGHID